MLRVFLGGDSKKKILHKNSLNCHFLHHFYGKFESSTRLDSVRVRPLKFGSTRVRLLEVRFDSSSTKVGSKPSLPFCGCAPFKRVTKVPSLSRRRRNRPERGPRCADDLATSGKGWKFPAISGSGGEVRSTKYDFCHISIFKARFFVCTIPCCWIRIRGGKILPSRRIKLNITHIKYISRSLE